MPAGLDGNPDPIVTPERNELLAHLTGRVGRLEGGRRLVGIDGASATGKSTLGDELASRLCSDGLHVVRSTIDSFHRPRRERMARGPTSPEGYYLDSHQIDTVVGHLLVPFAGDAPRVQIAAFDEPTDSPLDEWVEVPTDAVLVFDGLFLHRPELVDHWDLTIFLMAEERRAAAWDAYLHDGLPPDAAERDAEIEHRLERARWPRYHEGWQLYLDAVDPMSSADVAVDNDNFERPRQLDR